MSKTVHRIKLRYPPKTNLCRSCRYAYGDRRRGLMCEVTGGKPDFYAFCPYFTLSKSRDQAAHEKDSASQENKTRLLELWTFMFVFIVLLSPVLALIGRSSVFVIAALLLIGYSVYTRVMSRRTANLPLFAYAYIVFVAFIGKFKKFSDDDKKIVYQTLVRLYGNDIASRALQLYENGFDLEPRSLSRLVKLMSRWDRRFLYTLLFQLFVYDNVLALDRDNVMKQLAPIFGVTDDEYIRLKEIYSAKEYDRKYRRYKQGYRSHTGSQDLDRQFRILGLSPSATNEEIKRRFRQLAKMYHPDRQPNPEMAREAEEHFRLILSAYEKIKQARGIK